jgi:hypothetical protein
MDDPPVTGTTTGKPQTARGREMDLPDWLRLPVADRYLAATRTARQTRAERAGSAARAAVELARELAARGHYPEHMPEHIRWSVRGEPRHRRSFGLPHPGDFRGGLPTPREFPVLFPIQLALPAVGV